MKVKNRGLIVLLIIVLLLSSIFLCSCNKDKVYSDDERCLYLAGLSYDEDTLTVTATVSLSGGTDQRIPNAYISLKSESQSVNVFFLKYITNISYNEQTIFSAVDNFVTQEQRKIDGTLYSTLKVVYTYGTIYKSTTSNGTVIKSGRNYYHNFNVENLDEIKQIRLERKAPYSASWYILLTAIALVLGVVIVVITVIRGKHGRTKEESRD